MCLNANFVIVIITSFYISSMCYTRIQYGKACGEGANLGVCKTILECPSALAELKKQTYTPLPGCGFLANKTQIICCQDFKTPPLTNHNQPMVANDGRVWERVTTSSTNKPTPTLIIDKNRGQKSEAACRAYEEKIAPSIDTHITGGEDAQLGEFPHMAQIGYDSQEFGGVTDWKCGGSLIHLRFVLTAAHCVETVENPPKVVRLGFVNSSLSSDTKFVERDVIDRIIHPKYHSTLKLNDIALIELANEVKIEANVHPACLYQKNDDPTDMIATGWGSTSTEATIITNARILQKVDIEAADLINCSELYARIYMLSITPKQMCGLTPNTTADTCQGDSGGPIQIMRSSAKFTYEIVGVTSHGDGCGNGVIPGVYTRVYSYIDWIESVVWP